MFDSLSDRFDAIFTRMRGKGRLGEKEVDEIAREIRLALLEADVNFKVVKSFIGRIKEQAAGAELSKSLSPAQQVIKIVHQELVNTLGGTTGKLTMNPKPPTVVMLVGLQGSGKTILFAGIGEKLVDFEAFHPDRMAGRILGMGDVLTLIEKAEESFDQEAAVKAAGKLRKGNFTLDDFLEQMQQVKKMGPLQNIIGMIPGIPKELKNSQIDDKELGKVEAIIRSMTPAERNDIALINGSRRLRIAQGSGTSTQDVNALLKQFKMVQGMMKQMGGGGGKRPRFPGLPGMPGM